jgi:hypothetical protein
MTKIAAVAILNFSRLDLIFTSMAIDPEVAIQWPAYRQSSH